MSDSVGLNASETVILAVDNLLAKLRGEDNMLFNEMELLNHAHRLSGSETRSKWVARLGPGGRYLFPQALVSDFGEPHIDMFTDPNKFRLPLALNLINGDPRGYVDGWLVASVYEPVHSGFVPVAFPLDCGLAVLNSNLPFDERVRLFCNAVRFYGYLIGTVSGFERIPRDLVRSFCLVVRLLRTAVGSPGREKRSDSDYCGDQKPAHFDGHS